MVLFPGWSRNAVTFSPVLEHLRNYFFNYRGGVCITLRQQIPELWIMIDLIVYTTCVFNRSLISLIQSAFFLLQCTPWARRGRPTSRPCRQVAPTPGRRTSRMSPPRPTGCCVAWRHFRIRSTTTRARPSTSGATTSQRASAELLRPTPTRQLLLPATRGCSGLGTLHYRPPSSCTARVRWLKWSLLGTSSTG